MYRPLVPCPECHRHVRGGEAHCPFCGVGLPSDLAASAVPGTRLRLSRAAAFVFGATVAVTGCSSEVTDGKAAAGSDEGSTSGEGATSGGGGGGDDAGPKDDGGHAALYGVAPDPDAGVDDGGAAIDSGEVAPDSGGGQPLYGAPPPDDG